MKFKLACFGESRARYSWCLTYNLRVCCLLRPLPLARDNRLQLFGFIGLGLGNIDHKLITGFQGTVFLITGIFPSLLKTSGLKGWGCNSTFASSANGVGFTKKKGLTKALSGLSVGTYIG